MASGLSKRGSKGKPSSPDLYDLCGFPGPRVQRTAWESRAPGPWERAWQRQRGGKQREVKRQQGKEAADKICAHGSCSQCWGSWDCLLRLWGGSGKGSSTSSPGRQDSHVGTPCIKQGFRCICKAMRDLGARSFLSPCCDPAMATQHSQQHSCLDPDCWAPLSSRKHAAVCFLGLPHGHLAAV